MTKVKGFCVLMIKPEDPASQVNKLKVGTRYGFEKEYIESMKQDGYTVIDGTNMVKLKKDSFDKFFEEVPEAKADTQKGTEKKDVQTSAILGPKAASEASRPLKNVEANITVGFDFRAWNQVKDMINFIKLTPAKNGNNIDVIINIKPDVDFSFFGTAEEVAIKLLPEIVELTSIKNKVEDLKKIIDERIKVEEESLKAAKKKADEAKEKAKTESKTKSTSKEKKTTDKPASELFEQGNTDGAAAESDVVETEAQKGNDTTEEDW